MRLHEIIGEFADVAVGEATTGVESGLPDDQNRHPDVDRQERASERRRVNSAASRRRAAASSLPRQRGRASECWARPRPIRAAPMYGAT